MAVALRAVNSLACAAPLRAAARRAARAPAARLGVRAMADESEDAPEGVEQLIDVRVGKVLKAYKHEDADKLYVEEVDIGEAEPRMICSGLVPYMNAEDIEGKLVVVLANLKSRNMAGVSSHGMLLCASDSSHESVELLVCPPGSVPGERIKFGDWETTTQAEAHTENQMKKKKTWEKVVTQLRTTDGCVAAYKDLHMVTSAGPVTCASIKGGTIGVFFHLALRGSHFAVIPMGFAVETPLQPFMGRKERRRSSAGKLFLGDHCDLRASPLIAKLLAKHGEPALVLFSEEVLKINRRGEAVPRVLLVAPNALFLLDSGTMRVRRKIQIKRLAAIRMSEHNDNFLALIHPEEYDVLLVCARKIEATLAIGDAFGAVTGRRDTEKDESGSRKKDESRSENLEPPRLPVELSSNFTYAAGADLTKRVTFTRLENGEVDTTVADIVG